MNGVNRAGNSLQGKQLILLPYTAIQICLDHEIDLGHEILGQSQMLEGDSTLVCLPGILSWVN